MTDRQSIAAFALIWLGITAAAVIVWEVAGSTGPPSISEPKKETQ